MFYKVALLSSGLGHVNRGIEAWTENLGRALHAQYIDVTVYKGGGIKATKYDKVVPCLQRNSAISKWIIEKRPGLLWRLGLGTGYILEQVTFTLSLLPELFFKKYDILHTQDPQVAEFLLKMRRLGIVKSKIILAHGTEEPPEFLQQFKYVQHLAPFHKEEMDSSGVKGVQSFAIGNFVDLETFNPGRSIYFRKELNIPEDAVVILSVAAIKSVHKRMDHLINEFSQIKNRKAYLLIVGARVDETEELIERAKIAIGERVIFLTDFPYSRIHQIYSLADIFVLCSFKEMMPLAILEALASGLPVIGHKYPVIEWMVGEGGECIDMLIPGALEEVLEKYLLDKPLRREKGKLAREQAEKNFSKEVIVGQIIKMYEKILEGKG